MRPSLNSTGSPQQDGAADVPLRIGSDTPEFVHWHGQFIPSDVDGAGEEKSLVSPPKPIFGGGRKLLPALFKS